MEILRRRCRISGTAPALAPMSAEVVFKPTAPSARGAGILGHLVSPAKLRKGSFKLDYDHAFAVGATPFGRTPSGQQH